MIPLASWEAAAGDLGLRRGFAASAAGTGAGAGSAALGRRSAGLSGSAGRLAGQLGSLLRCLRAGASSSGASRRAGPSRLARGEGAGGAAGTGGLAAWAIYFGTAPTLQFRQFLQVVEVFLQVGDTAVGLLGGLVARHQILLQGGDAGLHRLCIPSPVRYDTLRVCPARLLPVRASSTFGAILQPPPTQRSSFSPSPPAAIQASFFRYA